MLFTDEKLDRAPLPKEAAIGSPAGRFVFTVDIGGASLLPTASTAYRFGGDGILFRWCLAQAEAELLLCRNPVDLTALFPGRDEAHAAFLRVQAKSGSPKVGFSARLVGVPQGFHGGYDGGQNYLGLTWSRWPMTVSLGTADEDGPRGCCGRALPTRWRALIPYYGTFARSDGRRWIEIETPALEPPERCELGFGLAWTECGEDEDDDDSESMLAADYGKYPNRTDIKPTPRGWGNNFTPPKSGKKKS